MTSRPILDGLKVVEFAQLIAGPLAGTLLADLGADVVHVEAPGSGDASRGMGPSRDGEPLWWKVSARNKRCVTLDLRQQQGQEVAHRMAAWADVVIVNMRAATVERWNLDWETLHGLNPRLIMLQVSGNGTDTTARNDPGFGKVGEARSGVVAITGFPDGPPTHAGFSHGDAVTGLMGAFAISAAWSARHDPEFQGEWIDLALFESLFRLIEWQVIVHDQLGIVPSRAGNQLAVAPGAVINTYQASDGRWVTVTSATVRSVRNVAALLGEPEEDYATREAQLARRDRLDQLLRGWILARTSDEALAAMHDCEVVASRIFDITDILADQTYAEREDIVTVEDPVLGPIRMQGVVPKLKLRPGTVWRAGAALGEDNELVYQKYLGYSTSEYDDLVHAGVI